MGKNSPLRKKLAERYGMPETHTFLGKNIDPVEDRELFLNPPEHALSRKLSDADFEVDEMEWLYLTEGSEAEIIGEHPLDRTFERAVHPHVEVLGVFEYVLEGMRPEYLAKIRYVERGIDGYIEVDRLRPRGYRDTKL